MKMAKLKKRFFNLKEDICYIFIIGNKILSISLKLKCFAFLSSLWPLCVGGGRTLDL